MCGRMSVISEIDLRKLWSELDAYENELKKEGDVLEEVWVSIANLRKKNEEEMKRINSLPELDFLPCETVINLNVGGQVFETTVEVLTKDPYSILAALCRKKSPVEYQSLSSGRLFFLDRDWWIFRHLLSFLRSEILPNDLDTLKELYKESIYYRVEALQKAIENTPINQVHGC